jgi:hypothetical protein
MDVDLECPAAPSATGAFQLAWTGADGVSVTLRENGTPIYAGRDAATALSGRPAGSYAYTLEVGGAAAASCEVVVAPPSLALAWSLFAVGFVVFVATAALVVVGHRRTAEPR